MVLVKWYPPRKKALLQWAGRESDQQVEPGVVVEAGEPLLRIDRTDYELALAEARQALASAELALADAKALRQSARIHEAEATVAAARARIARAERDLTNTEITAPYRAVIDEQRKGAFEGTLKSLRGGREELELAPVGDEPPPRQPRKFRSMR